MIEKAIIAVDIAQEETMVIMINIDVAEVSMRKVLMVEERDSRMPKETSRNHRKGSREETAHPRRIRKKARRVEKAGIQAKERIMVLKSITSKVHAMR